MLDLAGESRGRALVGSAGSIVQTVAVILSLVTPLVAFVTRDLWPGDFGQACLVLTGLCSVGAVGWDAITAWQRRARHVAGQMDVYLRYYERAARKLLRTSGPMLAGTALLYVFVAVTRPPDPGTLLFVATIPLWLLSLGLIYLRLLRRRTIVGSFVMNPAEARAIIDFVLLHREPLVLRAMERRRSDNKTTLSLARWSWALQRVLAQYPHRTCLGTAAGAAFGSFAAAWGLAPEVAPSIWLVAGAFLAHIPTTVGYFAGPSARNTDISDALALIAQANLSPDERGLRYRQLVCAVVAGLRA